MQKLLRRTALAKRQAARRDAARAGRAESDNRKLRINEQVILNKTIREDRLAARVARREDWVLGPLAPRRDVGESAATYGAIKPQRLRGVLKAKKDIKKWGIVPGDRVVVIQRGHNEIGKIGTVGEVREGAEECTITDINMSNVAVPDYMLLKEQDKTPVRAFPIPIPLSAVRLVVPLPHPDTGVIRDVIINELELRKTTRRELKGDDPPSRFIAGLEPPALIEYPEKKAEEFKDNDCDTLRIEVEEKTWVPSVIKPPMPHTVIDELRNKFSKFRDRHDDAYIAKKKLEDQAIAEKKASAKKMMTPLQELHRKERAEKRARGKPVLSEDMLAKIGEVMAQQKPRALGQEASAESVLH